MPRHKTFAVEDALDVAIELFAECGYRDFGMADLASRLGISRSSVYATFGNKQSLFAQTLQRYGAECRAPGMYALRGAGSPRAALLGAFEWAAGADASLRRDRQCLIVSSSTPPWNQGPLLPGWPRLCRVCSWTWSCAFGTPSHGPAAPTKLPATWTPSGPPARCWACISASVRWFAPTPRSRCCGPSSNMLLRCCLYTRLSELERADQGGREDRGAESKAVRGR